MFDVLLKNERHRYPIKKLDEIYTEPKYLIFDKSIFDNLNMPFKRIKNVNVLNTNTNTVSVKLISTVSNIN